MMIHLMEAFDILPPEIWTCILTHAKYTYASAHICRNLRLLWHDITMKDRNTMLIYAIHHGEPRLFKALYFPDAELERYLAIAIIYNQIEIIKIILKDRPALWFREVEEAFYIAMQNNAVEIVDMLLTAGMELSMRFKDKYNAVISNSQKDMFALLLNAGLEPDMYTAIYV